MTENGTEHTCSKEREWGEVSATLKFFQDAESRREQRELEMVGTMKAIATQGEAIKHLQEKSLRHEKALDEAFHRIRKVETPPLFIKLARTRVGRISLAALVLMAVVGFVKNPEALGKFIKAVIG